MTGKEGLSMAGRNRKIIPGEYYCFYGTDPEPCGFTDLYGD